MVEEWKKANPTKTDEPKPEDLVATFFTSYAKAHPGKWPGVVEAKTDDGKTEKRIEPVASDSAIRANFFDMWLQDPANQSKVADLETGAGRHGDGLRRRPRPAHHPAERARRCTSSTGSQPSGRTPGGNKVRSAHVETIINALVNKRQFSPLSGLIGEPLVNVLEATFELDKQFPVPLGLAK